MVVEYKSVEFRGKVWVGYLGIYCIEMVFKVLEMYIVVQGVRGVKKIRFQIDFEGYYYLMGVEKKRN